MPKEELQSTVMCTKEMFLWLRKSNYGGAATDSAREGISLVEREDLHLVIAFAVAQI